MEEAAGCTTLFLPSMTPFFPFGMEMNTRCNCMLELCDFDFILQSHIDEFGLSLWRNSELGPIEQYCNWLSGRPCQPPGNRHLPVKHLQAVQKNSSITAAWSGHLTSSYLCREVGAWEIIFHLLFTVNPKDPAIQFHVFWLTLTTGLWVDRRPRGWVQDLSGLHSSPMRTEGSWRPQADRRRCCCWLTSWVSCLSRPQPSLWSSAWSPSFRTEPQA